MDSPPSPITRLAAAAAMSNEQFDVHRRFIGQELREARLMAAKHWAADPDVQVLALADDLLGELFGVLADLASLEGAFAWLCRAATSEG